MLNLEGRHKVLLYRLQILTLQLPFLLQILESKARVHTAYKKQ